MPPLCYTVLVEKRFDEAKSVAEKLLRSFPNSYKAVEKTSNFYSDAFLFTQNRANMERAIELTQRLFALVEDPTGATRFELLSRMANHYELLNDWETAQKYYREGNVGRVNDRALARCMGNAAKDRKAAEALSEVFFSSLAELLCDCLMLEQIWQEPGEPERAEAALNWGSSAIEALGIKAAKKYDPLAMTLYYELAFLQEKQGRSAEAQENIRTAVRIARDGGPGAALDFLTDERVHISAEDQGKSGVELILLLTQTRGSKALVAAAREEAGQER